MLALKFHPDKNKSSEESKIAFQKIGEAKEILLDSTKKALYDKSGIIEDAQQAASFEEAYNLYREYYPEISEEDINEFELKYRHSEEERSDVLSYYKK